SLALKRMIRWAAENDFDRIAWTTGDQQNKRYSLSSHVDSLDVSVDDDGNIGLQGYKGERWVIQRTMESWDDLAAHIGRDLAEEARKQLEEAQRFDAEQGQRQKSHTITLNTGDLEIGGEGMREFYDKIVP